MTGSVDDADDLVQETLLRAWRAWASFEGRAQMSTWLHRIATNVCLDALARRPARVLPQDVVPGGGARRRAARDAAAGAGAAVAAAVPRSPARSRGPGRVARVDRAETAMAVARTVADGRALILAGATDDLVPEVLAPPLFDFFASP